MVADPAVVAGCGFMLAVLVGECEVSDMMCAHPYVKLPGGITKKAALLSTAAREAATPHPCGQCLPCRINKSREWAHRIMLEAMCYEESTFTTLTYSDDHIPDHDSLKPPDFTNYIKRLRKVFHGKTIRYFGVGEYGDKSKRPHYHVCLFGLGSADAEKIALPWSVRSKGSYDPFGQVHVGEVNYHSASYISGYVIKKLTNPNDKRVQQLLGGRQPEFARASKIDGGIGYPALPIISKQLKSSPYFDQSQIVRELHYGKKSLPLGRYLSGKLKELMEQDEVFDSEVYEKNRELLEHFLEKEGLYYDNILKENAPKRLSMEKRRNLFKQRRIL